MSATEFSLKGYKDLRKIAEGGFGEVYSAFKEDSSGSIKVAIKRLKAVQAIDPLKRTLFENEVQILKKVNHPNLPRFLESFQSQSESILVMEYIPGVNLATVLDVLRTERSYVPPGPAFEILLQLCAALQYLHSFKDEEGNLNPIIHCDIKPKNVLLTPARIVLIDFTVAIHQSETRRHPAGTYLYMPAELFTGESPSIQSDLYALMATFYETVLLRPLIKEGGSISDVFGYLLSQKYLDGIRRMKIVESLKTFLLNGLAFEKEQRFSSADKMSLAAVESMRAAQVTINKDEFTNFFLRLFPEPF